MQYAAEYEVGIVGCGNMGECILAGILREKLVDGKGIIASVGTTESAQRLREKYPECNIVTENELVMERAQILILAVKPRVFKRIDLRVGQLTRVIISVLAGIEESEIIEKLKMDASIPIIRLMPNIFCRKGSGSVAVLSSVPLMDGMRNQVIPLISTLGKVHFVDDKNQFDAMTALNGSGPGFLALLVESFIEGGVMAGLSRHSSTKVTAQLLEGMGGMMEEYSPTVLREMVTTPGGCTAKGLLTLEEGAVRSKIIKAILEAKNSLQ